MNMGNTVLWHGAHLDGTLTILTDESEITEDTSVPILVNYTLIAYGIHFVGEEKIYHTEESVNELLRTITNTYYECMMAIKDKELSDGNITYLQ